MAPISLNEAQRAFIVDELQHYNSANRGATPVTGVCRYSAGCAVGRRIEDADICLVLDSGTNKTVDSDMVFTKLPQWMQDLGRDFLGLCQKIHDNGLLWTPEGLDWNQEYQGIVFREFLKDAFNGEDLYPLVTGESNGCN